MTHFGHRSSIFATQRASETDAICPFLSELPCQFGRLLLADADHIGRTAIPRMFERKRDESTSARFSSAI
jgi:hypothetical protein